MIKFVYPHTKMVV